jgi:YidC/Oxa1 family membrane protein insertase
MNRSTTVWLVAMIAMMGVWYFILPRTQPQAPPKPAAEMLQQAERQAREAGTDEKKLKAVLGAYDKVIGAHKGTEQAADAKLQTAIIYETKLKNETKAVQTYQALIKEFGKKRYAAAAIAKDRLQKLRLSTDIKNRPHPLYKFMDFFVKLTGSHAAFSYFFALVLVTLIFKLMVTPLTRAQFKSMREMQKIQPLVKELQEKYKGDQKKIGEETMALYKEHGVNPFSSCLPLLVQMPVLYMLYWMVRLYEYQFVQAHFLWIGSSLADKYPGIIGGNLAEPDIPLLVIYTISMIVSQKMTVMDPSQAQQQKMMAYTMPVLFAFIFKDFPAAFMLYWLVFNIISTTQQYFIMKQPLPANGKAVVKTGGEATEPPVKLVEELQKASADRPSQSARRRKKRY